MSEHDDYTAGMTPATWPIGAAPTRSLGSRMRRARTFQRLFGEPLETIRLGRFTLRQQIGASTSGDLYAAYDDLLERKVAILLLSDDNTGESAERAPGLAEPQALTQFARTDAVRICDCGEFAGRLFIVLKSVGRETLRQSIARSQEYSCEQMLGLYTPLDR